MNVKKTVKKIVALGTGAGLVGMTLMSALALAPDLADYPDIVMDGNQFDGKIVVGARAATEDLLGSLDIAASLQAASTTEVQTGSSVTSTDVTGDAKQIADAGDILEINEQIGEVLNTVTDDDLEMLASGRVETQKGETAYTQIIRLDPADTGATAGHVIWDVESEDDVMDYFLFFEEGETLFEYEIDFTSGFESDITSGVVDDFEDEDLVLFGQIFSIVEATWDDAADELTLELIAGDVTDTLTEGQTKTYEIDGTDYEVTVLVIGDSGNTQTVKFLVNGEVSDALVEGETDEVAGGLEIGVREIIETTAYRESDPGSIVEFYLGANKIELVSDGTGAGDVDIGDEDIEEATLVFDFTADTTNDDEVTLNSITYSLELDSDGSSGAWVAADADEGIRAQIKEAEGMINPGWDIRFLGMTDPDDTEIQFKANGDDEYDLIFTNRQGTEYNVPYLSIVSNVVHFGEEGASGDDFIFYEFYDVNGALAYQSTMFTIGMDDMFVLTDNANEDTLDEDADSWIFTFQDIDTDEATVTFADLNGDERTESYTGDFYNGTINGTFTANGDLTVGGTDFNFWIFSDFGSPATYTLAMDLNGDGVVSDATDGAYQLVEIVTEHGGILLLAEEANNNEISSPGTSVNATLWTVADDTDEDEQQIVEMVFTHDTNEYTTLNLAANGPDTYFNEENDDDNDDRSVGVNLYGTMFELMSETDKADELTIMYPSEQVEAMVYVIGGAVQTSSRTVGGGTAQLVNLLPVGLGVLDSEVSVDGANLIVVGGPCANTIAAELLETGADCAEGFEPGMGMIKTFDTGNNVAILAAGYSARDTVQTAQVLAEAAVGTVANLEGDSVEVVIAGGNDVTVRAAMEDDPADDADDMADDTDDTE